MSSPFVDVFGGDVVAPSSLDFVEVALSENTQFYWPDNASSSNLMADIMDIEPSAAYSMYLPSTTSVGVPRSFLIRNIGAFTITVGSYSGHDTVATIAPGAVKFIYLTDQSAPYGTWAVFTFGTGTSSADASALAGNGLVVSGATLAGDATTVSSSISVSMTSNDRARTRVFSGSGAVTYSLISAVTAGNGFFCMVSNQGSGSVTLDPSGVETIDGVVTKALAPLESLVLISTGSEWITVGYGRSTQFQFTKLVYNIAVGSPFTLTSAEAENKLLEFTGILTAAATVNVPAIVAVYYVECSYTGAFGLTIKTAAGTGVTLAAGDRSILYCDGTNVTSAQTASVAVSNISGGVAGAVVYQTGVGATGFTAAGTAGQLLVSGGAGAPSFTSTPTVTTLNKITFTQPATGATVTILDGKALTVNKSLTLTGTDGVTVTFPSTNATMARTDAAQTFTGDQRINGGIGVNIGAITNAAAYMVHASLADASVHYGSYSLTTTSVARGGASDMGTVGAVTLATGYTSSTGASAYGVSGQVLMSNAVSVADSVAGLHGAVNLSAAGSVPAAYGARVALLNSGGATVTNAVGYSCPDMAAVGTNMWAFLGDMTSGTNKYNLYMRGTAGNYLNGSLGVGTVPVYYAKSAVVATLSDTTIETYGIYSSVNVTAASGAWGRYGIGGLAATAAGWGNTGTVAGLLGVGTHAIAGTANAIRGVSGYISSTGGGSISEANVVFAANGGTSGGGTIASLRGFYSADLTAGTINTGFYSAVTAGANKWGVYTASANNYFGGPILRDQPTPTTETTTGTLLIAELLTQIIIASGTSYTLTLDTGANCEAGITAWPTDGAIDWHVISTASGTVTIAAAASGHTIVGTATIAAGASAHFRTRKTGTNTFVTYRLA